MTDRGDRYVVLGLAGTRATWFTEVARWATSGMLPLDYLKCLSVDELLSRLRSARPSSAVLIDGGIPGLDRDLLSTAVGAGCAVLVVDDEARRGWTALGAAAVLPSTFDRTALLDALRLHAQAIGAATDVEAVVGLPAAPARTDGLVVAVCGPGGTGASTTAAALAQGLAAAPGSDVLLADAVRNAEQAVLHDVGEVAPGLQELVESHRGGWPAETEVRALTWAVPSRGYRLLLGLRRAKHWNALRPRAVEAGVDSLAAVFDQVVFDVDADLDADDVGTTDLADRTAVARAVARRADVVVVVGRPGVKGTHALLRVVTEMTEAGVSPERLLPVVVGAPRQPRARAELVRAVAGLGALAAGADLGPVVLLPERRTDLAWRDSAPMPAPLPSTLAAAVITLHQRSSAVSRQQDEPQLVVPGSLGLA